MIRNSPPLVIDTNENSSIPLSNPIEKSSENSSSLILPQSENLPCQMDSIQSIEDELIHPEAQSLLDQLIQIIEQQENSSETKIDKEENQLINDSSEGKEEETIVLTIESKTVKRKRRQSQICPFVSKRRKRRQSKDQFQWWINKYSIQPISIFLDRVDVPID